MTKYHTETSGVAPIAALLLAMMMAASLTAMNLTAERALSPAFSSNPLASLTRPIVSAGVFLRNAAAAEAQRPAPVAIEVPAAQASPSAAAGPPAVPAPVAGPAAPPVLSAPAGEQVVVRGKSRKGQAGASGKQAKRNDTTSRAHSSSGAEKAKKQKEGP